MRQIMYYGDELKNVSVLIGKTITEIEKSDDSREVNFKTDDGKKYKMFHQQDCCEDVYLADIVGELSDLVGRKIIKANKAENRNEGKKLDEWDESYTWTFYHFTTEDGYDVTLRWYGTSNGYYSEDVDLVELE